MIHCLEFSPCVQTCCFTSTPRAFDLTQKTDLKNRMFKKKRFILFLHGVYVYACGVRVPGCRCLRNPAVLDLLEVELEAVVSCLMWVLGTTLVYSLQDQ